METSSVDVMDERALLEKFVTAKTRLNKADAEKSDAEKEFEIARAQLADSLQERGAKTTAKYPGIGSVTMLEPRVQASYDKEREQDLFNFIKENGEAELVKLTVHPQSLNGFVSRMLKGEKGIPEFLNYYLRPSLRLNAWKSSKVLNEV